MLIRVAVFAGLLLSQQVGFAQSSLGDSRKTTVDRFLTAWLVQKNITAALRFFHPQALKSFPVIDNCIGKEYVAAPDKDNPIAIRRAVRKSLRVSSARTRGHTLRTILSREGKDAPRQQTDYLAELTRDSFNQPKRDHYWLMTFEKIKSRTPHDSWDEYEKLYDMRNAFVSIIQYHLLSKDRRRGDDLVVMFLWVKRGPEWKIVFVTIPECDA
jgi:hypothetical protein